MSIAKETEISGFLDGQEYTAAFLYEFFALLVGNGVYAGELTPTATNEDMTITHGSGHAWINGVCYKNETPFTLDIATADGTLNRYDSLMVRLDLTNNETYAIIVQGESAVDPSPPAVTRNAETFDLKICDIYIPAGCTKITPAQVTDTRLNTSVCGIPVFPVEHLDMSTFYKQISADLASLKQNEQDALDALNKATDAARMQYDPYKLLRMDVLWVNSSPNTAYGENTAKLSVSPMECEAFEILYRKVLTNHDFGDKNTELEIISSGIIPLARDELVSYSKRFCTQVSTQHYVANRYFALTDTGIAFEKAEIAQYDSDLSMLAVEPLIPLAIYGFRKPEEDQTAVLQKNTYGDTPFRLIDLPQNQKLPRYAKQADGTFAQISTLNSFTPIRACPKYLGFRMEKEAVMYLYIGDMVDGEFVPDPAYTFATYTNSSGDVLVNYLNSPDQSRIVETDGSKYFYYCIRQEGEGVTIIGCDTWPESQTKNIAVVPDSSHKSKEQHTKNGANYSLVLPEDCNFAVLVKDAPLDADGNPTYDRSDFHVACVMESDTTESSFAVTRACAGASFGFIPAGAGAALLTIPGACPLENVTVYTSKEVKIDTVGGRQQKARELARKLITDFSFISRKDILWNDSSLPLTEGKRYHGVPYSSRWVNSHFVGFEVSVETALNALNDPYSIAYDGGKESIVTAEDGTITATWFEPVSGHTEISRNEKKPREGGGPGYGLVCSAFTSLLCGNPYPQSNRGFTFDSNFCVMPVAALPSGTIAVNSDMTHCVMVDELYDNGYAILEAADPCVTQTVHTNEQPVSGALYGKTRLDFLDSYMYSVNNQDDSGYSNALLDFDNMEIPNGVVRPWRGHKAVYGSWDKEGSVGDYTGSGIGITIHPTDAQMAANKVPVIVTFVPQDGGDMTEVLNTSVTADTLYLDIGEYVTKSGTYTVSCGDGNAEKFRYYAHDAVTLHFDADGKAVFSHDDVLYAYVHVTGYGGTWGRQLGGNGGPMVIATGKYYPDLAADTSRIDAVYAAIVADPENDCWGKYSCICAQTITSEYVEQAGDLTDSEYVALMEELEGTA